ncbi:CheY-like chemotaxis protein [Arthrobacter pascens]|uniref:phosphotransferase n=1 Tax=Arthrobacter pascens TaxID=1677 RepID=UPI00277E0A85|nr:phosphotransferase [Arthrobacter pascens]MDQ0632396.1 CheY-like chemotaxis protein [Arthrobacter pascens]
MKILLVEDEDRSVRQAMAGIDAAAPGAFVTVVGSRDEAVKVLHTEGFDLIVCDLRIPPYAASADISDRHGLAVHTEARESCPGTPIVFLSAFATPRNTSTPLSFGGTQNVFGLSGYPMVQLIEKDDLDRFEALVRALFSALTSLDTSCQVLSGDVEDDMFLRAVRIYAKQISMSQAEIHAMPGGLSNAPLGRVSFSSTQSGRANVFMKVVSFADAESETLRFQEFVPNRLQGANFAPSLPPITAGLRGQAALISNLADGCDSLFGILRTSDLKAAEAVKALKIATTPWEHAVDPAPTRLGDLRKRRINNDKLETLNESIEEFRAIESCEIAMKSRICHGDLHGENVLVTPDGRPILIDFGDLGPNAAPLDPVTLELSIIFHKAGPARSSAWAESVDWASWADLETFAAGSPFESFIRECRGWALQQDSPDSVYGMAYAHSIRQFKYSDVNRAIARAIALSASRSIGRGA